MTVELEFGYLRVFDFYVVGLIYPKKPVSQMVADNIVNRVHTALKIYFDPASRRLGEMPTMMEIINVIRNADSQIDYFDAGSKSNDIINWRGCDPTWFNAISFAKYVTTNASGQSGIQVAPSYIV